MAGTGERPELAGLRVLLVDDHRDSAESMAWLLRSFGCEAQARLDARSALEDAETLNPDVIFLDIRLPDMPGTELCRRLREKPALADALLVALSGAADDATQEAIRDAGFHRSLTKPVELPQILDLLTAAAPR